MRGLHAKIRVFIDLPPFPIAERQLARLPEVLLMMSREHYEKPGTRFDPQRLAGVSLPKDRLKRYYVPHCLAAPGCPNFQVNFAL